MKKYISGKSIVFLYTSMFSSFSAAPTFRNTSSKVVTERPKLSTPS